ncbi:MAG: efflux RND transporter periplasmic adaptor subunit [Desulfobacterales bacterium]|nr:efflux RND transporter periplasmic adaptor subunit [Desulfobacterales bacterium]
MKKWIFIGLGLLGLLLISVVIFGTENSNASKPADSVEKKIEPDKMQKKLSVVTAEVVKPIEVSKILEITGSIVATRVARIASPSEGPVQDCNVREGDFVKEGQKIITIGRNIGVEAILKASQASFNEQEEELKRIEQLVQSGAIPASQLDIARSKYENTKALVAKSKEYAEDYSIKVPWDGIVTKVLVKDGDYVAPRAPTVEIFDPKSLALRFAIPEHQAMEIEENTGLKAQLDAYPDKIFQGKIIRIYPELDMKMRTRTVEAIFNAPVALIPGMFARIKVFLKNVPDALTVLSDSIIVTPKGERIIFLVEDGKAVRRKIETGIEQNNRVQVVKGIKPGDKVVTEGNEKLKDGEEIQVNIKES